MTHHEHVCECGSTLACARADCAVAEPFLCPSCEFDMRDEYFQQLELETEHNDSRRTEPNQEPT